MLLERGADANQGYKTAMHWASENGDIDLLKRLIQNGGLVDVTDSGNETPLHSAVKAKQINASLFLLENEADFQSLNEQDETALSLAIDLELEAIVEAMILKSVPNIRIIDKEKLFCLGVAKKNFDFFEPLLNDTKRHEQCIQSDDLAI